MIPTKNPLPGLSISIDRLRAKSAYALVVLSVRVARGLCQLVEETARFVSMASVDQDRGDQAMATGADPSSAYATNG